MVARVALALLSLLAVASAPLWGHPSVDDPGLLITSDFGPRFVTGGSPFHKGIDYQRAPGDPVPLLEDGTVTSLFRGTTTDIVILQIQGAHTFRNLHLFNDDPLPIFSGGFVLAEDSSGALAIARQNAAFPERADYILSPNPGRTVTLDLPPPGGGTPVPTVLLQPTGTCSTDGVACQRDTDCAPTTPPQTCAILSARTIKTLNMTDHPVVGASGTSGGFAPHLHIDLGFGISENPLYHIEDRDSEYVVRMLDKDGNLRLQGYSVGPLDPDSTFLKLQVESGTPGGMLGKDLESVRIYVDAVDAAHLVREFTYGGQTAAHDPIHANTDTGGSDLSNGLTDGVQPVAVGTTGIVGLENFVYNDWESAAPMAVRPSQLADGEHRFIFVLRDVQDNIPFANGLDPEFRFEIDNTAPTTSITVTKD